MAITIVGSIAYDSVETPNEKREKVLGGSATYFCYAASFLSKTRLVGIVGDDFAQDDIAMLERIHVDMEGVQSASGKTFAWGARYEENMNVRHTVFTDLNVFENFEPVLPESYKQSEVVFLANIHPALQHHVLDQVESPKFVAADSMNLWIDIAQEELKGLLPRLDVLIINDEEVSMLARESHLPKAAQIVRDMGVKNLIVKKGGHGAILFGDDSVFMAPAFPLKTLEDPTGAGDSFAGGFMGYLDKMQDFSDVAMRKAMIYGSVLGSFACEAFGFDRFEKLTGEEIEERFQTFARMMAF